MKEWIEQMAEKRGSERQNERMNWTNIREISIINHQTHYKFWTISLYWSGICRDLLIELSFMYEWNDSKFRRVPVNFAVYNILTLGKSNEWLLYSMCW